MFFAKIEKFIWNLILVVNWPNLRKLVDFHQYSREISQKNVKFT